MTDETLPVVFRKSTGYTASFDWMDATTGHGYRRYYGAGRVTVAQALDTFLTSRIVGSSSRDTTSVKGFVLNNGGGGAEIDVDFDITFQVPATVAAADAFVALTIQISGTSESSKGTVTIYHVTSGGVETSLGTISNSTITSAAAGTSYYRLLFKVTTTEKHFSAGEKLRVNFTSTETSESLDLHFDPDSLLTFTDLDSRTIGTDFIADVPFVVDL